MHSHFLIRNIAFWLRGYSSIMARHVYLEINMMVDWVASYVTSHLDQVVWPHFENTPSAFRNYIFFLFFFLGCIRTKIID